jgi:hypothetical protein
MAAHHIGHCTINPIRNSFSTCSNRHLIANQTLLIRRFLLHFPVPDSGSQNPRQTFANGLGLKNKFPLIYYYFRKQGPFLLRH